MKKTNSFRTWLQRKHSLIWQVLVILGFLLVAMTLTGCRPSATPTPIDLPDGYPNDDLLVKPAWLADRLDDGNVRIIDMRPADMYADAHIPGAVNVPVGDVTATVDGVSFRFAEDEVQETLNRIGLIPEMTVVIYDNLGMMSAARLFWTLEHVGHADVRLLHGGWNAWVGEAREFSEETPTVEPTEYALDIQDQNLVTAEEILTRLDDPDVVIVDARSPEEYSGEVKLADRGGHIPGAVNLAWRDALTGGDTVSTTADDWRIELRDGDVEYFKPPDELQALLDDRGITTDKQAITYCQTLWRGAHVYFLLRLMGVEDVRGYDGSWAEWGNDPGLPVVTGPEPGEYEQ